MAAWKAAPPCRYNDLPMISRQSRYIPDGAAYLGKNGYTLTSLARYRIDALVISTEPSWFDGGADLSPVDFAVAWGPMSDPAILGRLSVTAPICT